MGELDEGSQILFLQHLTANEAAIRAFVRRLVPLRSDTNDVMQQVAMVRERACQAECTGSL